jgi:hypothetical protein
MSRLKAKSAATSASAKSILGTGLSTIGLQLISSHPSLL